MPDINDVKKKLNVIIEELISHDSEEEWFEFKEIGMSQLNLDSIYQLCQMQQ